MLQEDCTEEFVSALQNIAKVEALELLHLQLGHLPYQRIEHMSQLGVLTGINLDKKLLHKLVRKKCDICIRAKATNSAHTGSLPAPDEAW
jgi:GAG-pre-integrase domain